MENKRLPTWGVLSRNSGSKGVETTKMFGPWPKKGTPLRFRAKKGHTGNEILESEKVPRKIFSSAQLGWLTKGYIFLPKKYNSIAKKGTFQHQ